MSSPVRYPSHSDAGCSHRPRCLVIKHMATAICIQNPEGYGLLDAASRLSFRYVFMNHVVIQCPVASLVQDQSRGGISSAAKLCVRYFELVEWIETIAACRFAGASLDLRRHNLNRRMGLLANRE